MRLYPTQHIPLSRDFLNAWRQFWYVNGKPPQTILRPIGGQGGFVGGIAPGPFPANHAAGGGIGGGAAAGGDDGMDTS